LFKDAPSGAFTLTELFDRAIEQERLFGLRLEGVWMHVGTPEAVAAAEQGILARAAGHGRRIARNEKRIEIHHSLLTIRYSPRGGAKPARGGGFPPLPPRPRPSPTP